MTNYSLEECENLIARYVNEYQGECDIVEEGVLGLGTIVLHGAKGKKSIIIKEFYLNEWSSGHSIRMYNVLPKKYKILVGQL